MLNRGYSMNKRSYADFSIEALLKKDYFKDRGTVRHGSDLSEGTGAEWNSPKGSVNCASQLNSDHQQTVSVTNIDKYDEDAPLEVDNPKPDSFPWLSCTRFKPPKLTRSRRKSNSSKRNGRGPRIPFSSHQLAVLERTFRSSQYLSSKAIGNLAESLQLTEVRVKIWFQNRRARYRRENDGSIQSAIRHSDITPRETQPCQPTFSFHDQGHGQEALMKTIPKSTSSNNASSPGTHQYLLYSPTVPALSKQSFRHLINDLNLMTANVNSSSNFNSYFKNYSASSVPIFSKEPYA